MSAASDDFEPLPDKFRVLQRIANRYDDIDGLSTQYELRCQLRQKRGEGLNEAIREVDRR